MVIMVPMLYIWLLIWEEVTMRKKLIFMLIIGFIVGGMIFWINNYEPKNYKCLVLGDSISTGYELEDINESYANQMIAKIREECISKKDDITIKNESVNGMQSKELLESIRNGKIEIEEDTDIITLSIGGNDILRPFKSILADIKNDLNKNNNSIEGFIKVKDKLIKNSEIIKSAKDFSSTFNKIIEEIKHRAPNSKIYVMNVYNPYNDCKILTFNLGDMVEEYIGILNNAFDNKTNEYITVNVFEAFKNEEYVTNADIMKLDFDPHPNSKGHKIIADLFVEAIKKDLS